MRADHRHRRVPYTRLARSRADTRPIGGSHDRYQNAYRARTVTEHVATSRIDALCFDANDPHRMAQFWALALGWEIGESDRDFKWNNYLSRYHWRHTDLMDVLANYNLRASAKLDEISTMLGFPGKMGMDGSKVWDNYLAGDIEGIRNYCETDVLNTYLIYLRYELMRGQKSATAYEAECERVRDMLQEEGDPHLLEFLSAWK